MSSFLVRFEHSLVFLRFDSWFDRNETEVESKQCERESWCQALLRHVNNVLNFNGAPGELASAVVSGFTRFTPIQNRLLSTKFLAWLLGLNKSVNLLWICACKCNWAYCTLWRGTNVFEWRHVCWCALQVADAAELEGVVGWAESTLTCQSSC